MAACFRAPSPYGKTPQERARETHSSTLLGVAIKVPFLNCEQVATSSEAETIQQWRCFHPRMQRPAMLCVLPLCVCWRAKSTSLLSGLGSLLFSSFSGTILFVRALPILRIDACSSSVTRDKGAHNVAAPDKDCNIIIHLQRF